MRARLHTLGVVARVWRGDGPLKELPLAPRMLLVELHLLGVDDGTWPLVPADTKTLAARLGMNPRPIDTLLKPLMATGFVVELPNDLTHLQLRALDALIRWRPLDELT